MSWYKLYKFAQSNEPYGYWLLPDGQFIDVRKDQNHLAILNERYGYDGYEDAQNKGFIRLVAPNEGFYYQSFLIDFVAKPNMKQINILENMIDKYYRVFGDRFIYRIHKSDKSIYYGHDPRQAKMALFQ